jgi:hypothetical protein
MFFSIPGLSSAFSSICAFSIKKLVVWLILFLMLITFNRSVPKSIFKGSTSRVAIIYVIMYLTTAVYSIIRYNSVTLKTISSYYYFVLAIIFYFVMKKIIEDEKMYEWFIKNIVLIAMIYSTYMIVCKVVFEVSGIYLFDTTAQFIQTRGGSLRLARPANFICIGAAFTFCTFLRNNLKHSPEAKKYLFYFIIDMIALVYVTQTRIYQVAFLVSCFLGLLYFYNAKKKLIVIGCVLVAIPIIIPALQEFYQSFYTYENVWGTEIRLSGYMYFISHMFDGGLWGIGLVYSSANSSLLTGGLMNYVLTDMGYTGFLGVFGLMGLVFLFILVRLFIKNYSRLKKTNSLSNYPEAVVLPVFFLIITWSLSFADPQRCLYIPILLIAYAHMENNYFKDTRRLIRPL